MLLSRPVYSISRLVRAGMIEALASPYLAQARRCGIVTFQHRDIGASDLGFILFSHGFMVRTDGHCQGSAGEKSSSVRASVHIYNTPEEVDRLLAVLATME